jgi:hypothetical protein
MTNELDLNRRLREIEDRKIEILLEISAINEEYSMKVTELDSEYARLDEEHYQLSLLSIQEYR